MPRLLSAAIIYILLLTLVATAWTPQPVTAQTVPATADLTAPVFRADGAHLGPGWSLRLATIGRGTTVTIVDPVVPTDDGVRVQYAHATATEWYLRQGAGVEQGITLAASPGGDGPLVLTMTTPGAAVLVNEAGDAATLILSDTTRWRYDGLHVTDAHGSIVPAHLVPAAEGGIGIIVEDGAAVYPVTIDPYVAIQTITDPNASVFGSAVALSGDGGTLVVGAYRTTNGRGVVNVYTKSGGKYTAPRVLTDPGGVDGDSFGYAVAVSGDGGTVLIGALNTNSQTGAAYLYSKSNNYGTHTTLTAPGGAIGDNFGLAVAISNDATTLVIGAPGVNNGKGAAYLYTKIGSSYGVPLAFYDPGNGTGYPYDDVFGSAVALSGNGGTLVIGAARTTRFVGAVYVYERTGGNYGGYILFTEPVPGRDDVFGEAVAISGDGNTMVIGARGTNMNQGAAYVYTRSLGSFGSPLMLTAPGMVFGYFGVALAASYSGSTLLIGAWGTNVTRGVAYVYARSGGSYVLTTTLSDAAMANNEFGFSVAMNSDGSTLIVGAQDDFTQIGRGGVYVFYDTIGPQPGRRPEVATSGSGSVAPQPVVRPSAGGTGVAPEPQPGRRTVPAQPGGSMPAPSVLVPVAPTPEPQPVRR